MPAYSLMHLHCDSFPQWAMATSVWEKIFPNQVHEYDLILSVFNYHPESCAEFIDMPAEKIADFIRRTRPNHNNLIFENLPGNKYLEKFLCKIHQVRDLLGVSAQTLIYVTSCIDAEEIYEDWCDRNQISERINVLVISYWEYYVKYRSRVSEIHNQYIPALRSKKFLSVNQHYEYHKFTLVMLLHHYNLLDKGLVSHVAFPNWSSDDELNKQYDQNLQGELRDDQLYQIISNSRSQWGSDLNLKYPGFSLKRFLLDEDLAQYQDTGFSLVSESVFFNEWGPDTHYQNSLTSRTFATIMMKHPFMLVAFPGALSHLRKLGYKTFQGLIDESYDQISMPGERLIAIVKETQRLCAMSDSEWCSWQQSVKPLVEYNYQVFMDKKFPQDFVIN